MEGLSIDMIWEEYGLDQLQQGLANLFPGNEFSLRQWTRRDILPRTKSSWVI